MKAKDKRVIDYLKLNPSSSSNDVFEGLTELFGDKYTDSYSTLRRQLLRLKKDLFLSTTGKGKATKYSVSKQYELLEPIDLKAYLQLPAEQRGARTAFNFDLISDTLEGVDLFTEEELKELNDLQQKYTENLAKLNDRERRHAMELLSIDLTWKSSEIEGNTYTWLETERLLKEKKTADGKHLEEAFMLLNHKDAIDFLIGEPDFLRELNKARIEHLHAILTKDLGIERNIRKRAVAVGGTDYKPLDNEHQIREAVEQMCELINKKENIFEKAMLTILIVSYIQAFADGNKRTARITGNAILINAGYCPISFRTVEASDYKAAILLFYERNNLSEFKKVFIEQFKFAVNNYFG